MSKGYVISCAKVQGNGKYDYMITFSSGLSLGFSDEEVFEHFLYDEDRLIDDIESLCIGVLSARFRKIMISYVASSVRSVAQTRKYTQEKLNKTEKDDWDIFFTEAFDQALRYLQDLGYLDDYEYCRKYINTSMKLKPSSVLMIRAELENWRDGGAQDLAEHICDCAKRRNINTRHDDITVMAAIIEKTV